MASSVDSAAIVTNNSRERFLQTTRKLQTSLFALFLVSVFTVIQLYSPSDSESALTDVADGGLGGRGFGVGGDILFLPTNSTYVPGKSPFSCRPETFTVNTQYVWPLEKVLPFGRLEKPVMCFHTFIKVNSTDLESDCQKQSAFTGKTKRRKSGENQSFRSCFHQLDQHL